MWVLVGLGCISLFSFSMYVVFNSIFNLVEESLKK